MTFFSMQLLVNAYALLLPRLYTLENIIPNYIYLSCWLNMHYQDWIWDLEKALRPSNQGVNWMLTQYFFLHYFNW